MSGLISQALEKFGLVKTNNENLNQAPASDAEQVKDQSMEASASEAEKEVYPNADMPTFKDPEADVLSRRFPAQELKSDTPRIIALIEEMRNMSNSLDLDNSPIKNTAGNYDSTPLVEIEKEVSLDVSAMEDHRDENSESEEQYQESVFSNAVKSFSKLSSVADYGTTEKSTEVNALKTPNQKEIEGIMANEFSNVTVISHGTKTKSNLLTKTDVVISGEFEGSLSSEGKVIVKSGGILRGDVDCESLRVEGEVDGNISCNILDLGQDSLVKGNYSCLSFSAAPGAKVRGSINNTQTKDASASDRNFPQVMSTGVAPSAIS